MGWWRHTRRRCALRGAGGSGHCWRPGLGAGGGGVLRLLPRPTATAAIARLLSRQADADRARQLRAAARRGWFRRRAARDGAVCAPTDHLALGAESARGMVSPGRWALISVADRRHQRCGTIGPFRRDTA